jgi:hypothetical protein
LCKVPANELTALNSFVDDIIKYGTNNKTNVERIKQMLKNTLSGSGIVHLKLLNQVHNDIIITKGLHLKVKTSLHSKP